MRIWLLLHRSTLCPAAAQVDSAAHCGSVRADHFTVSDSSHTASEKSVSALCALSTVQSAPHRRV